MMGIDGSTVGLSVSQRAIADDAAALMTMIS